MNLEAMGGDAQASLLPCPLCGDPVDYGADYCDSCAEDIRPMEYVDSFEDEADAALKLGDGR